MNLMKLTKAVALAAAVCGAAAGCTKQSDGDSWAAKRAAAVDRVRPLVYNTDGCDMLYWPSNLPVTVKNFTERRLKDAIGTRISTVSYCPQSAGFGNFTCRKAGDQLVKDVPHPNGGHYNSASKFFALGTDALEMASDFCRTNGLEVFVSIRVNDQHDSASKPGALSGLYPKFKVEHPECLMGSLDRKRNAELFRGYAGWSCVDFGQEIVRERMKKFVRELVTNYDVDGIEYDFNRHFMLFRSVATGGVATGEEIGKMTQLMRDLKAVTEEVGLRRNHPIVIAMRMPDSEEYDLAVGADIRTWFREKLVDIWIGGGYFRLNHWKESVALAHEYGVKFYASLDETRIPGTAARRGLKTLHGRMTVPFYAGRMAAALAAGCDGIYVFNIENDFLRSVATIDPAKPQKKVYFACDRGAGGYRPGHWLKDGHKFNNLPLLDPAGNCTRQDEVSASRSPLLTVKRGGTYSFEMELGDDFGGAKPPKVTAEALTGLKENLTLTLVCNGCKFVSKADKDGICRFALPANIMRNGINSFSATFPADAADETTFNDFAVLENL